MVKENFLEGFGIQNVNQIKSGKVIAQNDFRGCIKSVVRGSENRELSPPVESSDKIGLHDGGNESREISWIA